MGKGMKLIDIFRKKVTILIIDAKLSDIDNLQLNKDSSIIVLENEIDLFNCRYRTEVLKSIPKDFKFNNKKILVIHHEN